MAIKLQPETRTKTCSACGEQYEYPIKGESSTRYHCRNCAALPETTRTVLEKLQKRIAKLEKQLAKLAKGNG